MNSLSPSTYSSLKGGKAKASRKNKASRKSKTARRRAVRKGGELITSGVATSAILLLANNNSNRIFPATRSISRKFSVRSVKK